MRAHAFHIYGLVALLVMSSACGNKQQTSAQQAAAAPVSVKVDTVTKSSAVFYDEYPAILSALNQVDLRAQVSGYITGIFFKDGDRVSSGQRLYTIDPQQYEANYQQAVANLAVQETNLLKAQKDADRYHELDKQDAIAKQQVDYADAALEAAKKQVDAAKAAVRSVQTSVRYSTIFAPFTGTIGISQVKMGAPVIAGQTVLNTVSSDNPMAADVAVDQKEIYRFTQMQRQKKVSGDSTFTLALGNDLYPFPGSISLIDRAADPQTSTIRMRLVFPNEKNLLRAGMSGTIRVLNKLPEEQVVIPFKAVTEQLGEYFAYVVHDSTVTQRKLQLGRQLGKSVIVMDGLATGDIIVTEGVQTLREGANITVARPGSAPAAGNAKGN